MQRRLRLRRACRVGLATTALCGGSVWAQDAGSSSSLPAEPVAGAAAATPPRGFFRYDPDKIDISLGVFAQLTSTRTTLHTVGPVYQQDTAGVTPSAGFLGVFHQQFRGWAGYDINAGYSRTAYNYSAASLFATGSSFSKYAVGTNMYELSVAYVAKAPASSRRLQAFVQGGGGVLAFLPTQKLFPGRGQLSRSGAVRRGRRLPDQRPPGPAHGVSRTILQDAGLCAVHDRDADEQAVYG